MNKSNDQETSDSKIDDSINSFSTSMLENWKITSPFLKIMQLIAKIEIMHNKYFRKSSNLDESFEIQKQS